MENVLTTHCKMIDYTKNLLFNSTNESQENQARRILELAEKQEEFLYIN